MYFLIASFLVFSAALNAVLLPGACPSVPPTHHLKDIFEFASGVLGVPFAKDKSSYVFNNTIAIGELDMLFQLHLNTFQMSNQTLPKETVRVQVQDTGNSSLNCLVSKSIGVNPVSVLPPIQEELRVWVDGNILLLWSCKDDDDLDQHDEALLFAEAPNSLPILFIDRPEGFMKWLQILKMTAEKFLSTQMINAIDWEQKPKWSFVYKEEDKVPV